MKVYLVGGAVRDALMNRPESDKDYVVVGATEEDMLKRGFSRVGQSFPVFLHPTTGEEWALARTERKNGSGYTGFDVSTEGVTLAEDLFRRDLTINAIAMDRTTGEIVDPYGGQKDIQEKVLRHVSDAFMEDPLRVVRLARFYSRYTDFSIALTTVEMAQRVVLSGEMEAIPRERYWAEMEKMMADKYGDPQRFFEALHLFGALQGVSFFRDAFAMSPATYMIHNHIGPAARVVKHVFGSDFCFLAMVVATAKKDADLDKASSEIQEAHSAFSEMVKVSLKENTSAEEIFGLLSFCRATSRMSAKFSNALMVLAAVEHLIDCKISASFFAKCASASQSVSAAPFMAQGLDGKALGAAMDMERMNRIEKVIA